MTKDEYEEAPGGAGELFWLEPKPPEVGGGDDAAWGLAEGFAFRIHYK